jgi:D-alanyl-D-alanine carboxypeptidase (penicillin-binding protein 5/6)
MHRSLLFSLLFLCACVAHVQATPVPVLKSSAKQQASVRTATPAPQPVVVQAAKQPAALSSKVSPQTVILESQAKQRLGTSPQGLAQSTVRQSLDSNAISRLITSKSVMILDAHTGEALFAKAPDTPRQPASTIKVLTGMIAMKRLKEDEKVEVSPHAESMPRSKIYLRSNQSYRAADLINAVLLSSANDASVALAEKIAGSEADFAKLMTLHASLWGAKNTICRTASGLTAQGQQSTARDLAQIFRHAMQDKDFARRIQQTQANTSYGTTLRNRNRALWEVEGALGGKTGYTNMARQTYVGQFKRGSDSIVVAIMGSETMWADVKRLVEYGFQKKEEVRLAQLAQNSKTSGLQ